MYHPVGIDNLSENQLSRLRNGHSVRDKLGNHHKVHLSVHHQRNCTQHINTVKHQQSVLTLIKRKLTAVECLEI